MTERRKDVLAIAFLIVLITVFFSAELFTDRTLVTYRLTGAFPWRSEATPEELAEPSVTSDCTFSYLPRRVFATRMMRQGEIPLWNPHQFCGTPFLANYQSGVLYPVNLALYPVDPYQQMDIYLYVHFLVAAVFTYLLVRRLGASLGGALVSAVAFTFSGFMATRYGQPTFVSTAAYIPALIFLGEGLVTRPCLKRAGMLAAGVAMCILAGFPQLVFLAVYCLVAYMILRVVLAREAASRSRVVVFALLAFSIAVAALISAFQLLPTYELSTYSYRKELPYEMILSSAHHRLAALKYFVPDSLGHPLDTEVGVVSKGLMKVDIDYGFNQNYVSTTGYAGVLTLLLALLALLRPRRKMLPFVVLGGIALATVFGTPVLRVFYSLLPGFKFSRIDRIVVIYMLCVSVLAGFGFDLGSGLKMHKGKSAGQNRGGEKNRGQAPGSDPGSGAPTKTARTFIVAAAAFAVFSVLLGMWLRTSGADVIVRASGDIVSLDVFRPYLAGKAAAFMLLAVIGSIFIMLASFKPMSMKAFTAVALCLLFVDLLPFAARFKVSQPAGGVMPPSEFVEQLPAKSGRSRIVKFASDVLPASTPTLLEIDDIHGYNALNVNYYLEVLGAVDPSVIATENAALRRRIGPLSSGEALQSPILDMMNAAYILTAMLIEGKGQPIRIGNDGVLPRAYLVGGARFFGTYDEVLGYMKTGEFDPRREVVLVGESGAGPDSAVDAGRVSIASYGPHEVVIGVDAARDCYLFISDTFYPGWRATIDGEEAPVLRANYAFRALSVREGKHEVVMAFESTPFRTGIILSIAGLVLLAVMLMSRSAVAGL
ncbi:MAG: YfhO family protein [bacterium]|jgi:hypothetical protein